MNGEEGHTGNNENIDETVSQKDNKSKKKRYFIAIIKILVVLAIIGIALVLIYTESRDKKAGFFISDKTITDTATIENIKVIPLNSKLYFYIQHIKKSLSADSVSLELTVLKDKDYVHYKQITYEVDKQYPYVDGYISGVYFSTVGTYKLKLYLDNNLVKSHIIQVNKEK